MGVYFSKVAERLEGERRNSVMPCEASGVLRFIRVEFEHTGEDDKDGNLILAKLPAGYTTLVGGLSLLKVEGLAEKQTLDIGLGEYRDDDCILVDANPKAIDTVKNGANRIGIDNMLPSRSPIEIMATGKFPKGLKIRGYLVYVGM